MISSSSSSSPCKWNWKYDVFLSFRGEDTRKSFTDHLYTSLKREGIHIFRDENEIQNGITISLKLLEAIEASQIAIVVFSKNYASSTWCLEELVKILQCNKELGQTLLPIFYDIDPSDVRKQNGTFAEAFAKHHARFGEENVNVIQWRDALSQAANLKGWNSNEWSHETELIEEISREIWKIILPNFKTTNKNLVGVESRLKEVVSLLDVNLNSTSTFIVGIWGMGGIGKTTIARAAYDQIYHNFEVYSFLSNIKDEIQSDLASLQGKFLSMILMKKIEIWDSHKGSIMMEKVLSNKKILLVLDDVDQLDQIEGLIPNQHMFGSGSRIIITTRNDDLLITFGVERRYEVRNLENDEAIQLLSLNAFGKPNPKEGYLDFLESIVKHVGGLPLALHVLGSSLRNKEVKVWKNAIAKLKEGTMDEKIFKALKLSYDGLNKEEKETFLDIACFFKGKKKQCVVKILDGCDNLAMERIELLIQKSLITVSQNDRLKMHDLLQEMGREVIRRESKQNPCKYSRLWNHKDVKEAVKSNMVIEEIQSIISKSKEEKLSIFDHEIFSRMPRLRLLNVCNIQLPEELKCIPIKLRYLKWRDYPLEFLEVDSEASELIELHMCHSKLKLFWKGRKCLNKLKYIKLSHSRELLETPNFAEAPNLEQLDLEGCTNLHNIHSSIFSIKKLLVLNLKNCTSLKSLPNSIEIEILRNLILSGCSKIEKIPEFVDIRGSLLELSLDGTSIVELPATIGNLSGLTKLNLKNCNNLLFIPNSFSLLKSLKSLDFSGCPRLGNPFSENLENTEDLEELDVRGTAIRKKPSLVGLRCLLNLFPKVPSIGFGAQSLSGLSSLTQLNLNGCNLGALPNCIDSLSSLEVLDLNDNNFSYLPATMSRLSNLRWLYMDRCKRLLSLPNLPHKTRFVSTQDCISLQKIEGLSLQCGFNYETIIDFRNCIKLESNDICRWLIKCIQAKDRCFESGILIIVSGNEVPMWFTVRVIGSSIPIELGQYSSISLAGCVVYGPRERADEAIEINNSVLDNHLIGVIQIFFRKSSGKTTSFTLNRLHRFAKSDHISLFWVPLPRRHCTDVTSIYFRPAFANRKDIEVKKCGIRLISKEEIPNLQTMDQWDAS